MSQLVTPRQKIDEYLDGMLDAAGQRDMEAALAADPAAGRLVARMKSERALRAAAYESCAPTAQESARYAAQFMAAANQPVGRIGPWLQVRRLAAIAAAVAVVIGTFAAGHFEGRISAPPATVATVTDVKPVYRVVVVDSTGSIQRESEDLASDSDLSDYVKALNQSTPTMTASNDDIKYYVPPGHF